MLRPANILGMIQTIQRFRAAFLLFLCVSAMGVVSSVASVPTLCPLWFTL
jgi:hypothetical protein